MSSSFADLGVSRPWSTRSPRAASRGRSRSSGSSSPTCSPAATCSPSRRPARARRSRSRVADGRRASSAGDARPAALVLAPTRELAAQIVDERRRSPRARGLEVAAVYGGVGFDKQIRAARRAHMLVATPGRLEDLIAAPRRLARRRRDPRPRRGRPDARHGLPPRRRPHRRRSARATARRCSSRPRSTARPAASPRLHRTTPSRHEHAPPPQRGADDRAPLRRASTHERQARGARATSCARDDAASRSSSCAPSAAPTGSSSASAARASTPSRCTATSPSASASSALAALRRGHGRHARRHRRRRPRHRRRRHRARHQLRPAGRPRGLRAPRRPHRPRGRDRRRHHVRG